jgi:hypothetical protein
MIPARIYPNMSGWFSFLAAKPPRSPARTTIIRSVAMPMELSPFRKTPLLWHFFGKTAKVGQPKSAGSFPQVKVQVPGRGNEQFSFPRFLSFLLFFRYFRFFPLLWVHPICTEDLLPCSRRIYGTAAFLLSPAWTAAVPVSS